MASVEKREDRPKPWLVRWRDEEGRQRKKSFARKVDADRFRSEVEHRLNSGTYVDPQRGRETLRMYAERWRVAQPHRPNTAARTKSQLEKHVYPVLGDRPLAAIRSSELQAFVTGVELAPSSVRPLWGTLRAILGAAVRDRAIGHDPTGRHIKLPELPVEEVVPLSVGQVDALAAAVPPRYRCVIAANAGSGLRQGELFGIEVRHVDMVGRTLKVDQQVQPAAGGGVVICPLKNRHSYRTVPIGQAVVDAIAAHLEEFPAEDVEVRDTTGRRPVVRKARLVFTDAAGKALNRNDFNDRIWHPARAAVGVRKATQHDLRHFFASLLIRGGLGPKVVAQLLGHADPSVTLRTYAHLWPDDEDRSRQAVDAVLRSGDVPHLCPMGVT